MITEYMILLRQILCIDILRDSSTQKNLEIRKESKKAEEVKDAVGYFHR